jgi:hypothetical protein
MNTAPRSDVIHTILFFFINTICTEMMKAFRVSDITVKGTRN